MRIIVYTLLLVFLLVFLYYSEYNTINEKIGLETFKVHKSFENKKEAAQTLAEINKRLELLKNFMKKKYICGKSQCNKIIKNGLDEFDMKDRLEQFDENFNSKNLSEISPNNPLGSTSFTEGKGKKMVFCLRDKESGEIHDINTLMFVALHEATHVMNEKWGHGVEFWELFGIVIKDAQEANIYQPVNYRKYPQKYCGITIQSNPLFDFF